MIDAPERRSSREPSAGSGATGLRGRRRGRPAPRAASRRAVWTAGPRGGYGLGGRLSPLTSRAPVLCAVLHRRDDAKTQDQRSVAKRFKVTKAGKVLPLRLREHQPHHEQEEREAPPALEAPRAPIEGKQARSMLRYMGK